MDEFAWTPLALVTDPSCWPMVADFFEERSRFGDAACLRLADSLATPMVWCPPGQFVMGSPEDDPSWAVDEAQVDVVHSRGFWLGKYPVTQSEWKKVMGDNPSWFAISGGGSALVSGLDTALFPVETVSWHQALDFCRRLTERERIASRISPTWRYNLPTEAQWEYACRAGTHTATAFGARVTTREANINGACDPHGKVIPPYLERPSKVGSYAANAWGLHDMHGNVREWCLDTYDKSRVSGIDPVRDTYGDFSRYKTNRGGSWFVFDQFCRSASRGCDHFDSVCSDLGFRIALVVA